MQRSLLFRVWYFHYLQSIPTKQHKTTKTTNKCVLGVIYILKIIICFASAAEVGRLQEVGRDL